MRELGEERGARVGGIRRTAANVRDTVTGTLKGYDALMNLVLDDVDEVMRGSSPLFPSF